MEVGINLENPFLYNEKIIKYLLLILVILTIIIAFIFFYKKYYKQILNHIFKNMWFRIFILWFYLQNIILDIKIYII